MAHELLQVVCPLHGLPIATLRNAHTYASFSEKNCELRLVTSSNNKGRKLSLGKMGWPRKDGCDLLAHLCTTGLHFRPVGVLASCLSVS